MVLLIDVGNSNINLALYDNDDQPKHFWRIKTDRNKTTDEYAIILNNLFFGKQLKASSSDPSSPPLPNSSSTTPIST